MHELSIAQAIADTVDQRRGEREVRRVEVRIGHLRQVVPDSLLFSWEMITTGSHLDGCELVIEHVPAVVHCPACGTDSTLDLPVLACAACSGVDVELLTGEEFQLVSFDLEPSRPVDGLVH